MRRLPYLCTSDILESKKFANKIGYPVIVKPAKLGSSIGINTANDEKSLSVAVSEGLRYGSKVIIEKKLTSATVFEARPASRPYFEANMNVLFAEGTQAVIAQATSSVPVTPQRR